jgi:broad specificity phosphatase PhoE/predicted kinase
MTEPRRVSGVSPVRSVSPHGDELAPHMRFSSPGSLVAGTTSPRTTLLGHHTLQEDDTKTHLRIAHEDLMPNSNTSRTSLLSRRLGSGSTEDLLRPMRSSPIGSLANLANADSPTNNVDSPIDYQGFDALNSSISKNKRLRRLSFSDEQSHAHLMIALVGLPARGKSYIAKKILNFSMWRGHSVRVFNVGAYRRKLFPGHQTTDFFDAADPKMNELRQNLAVKVLQDALEWLQDGGQIAIFDATNTTKPRRELLKAECDKFNVRLLFIESICDDREVLKSNLLTKIAKSPDYIDMKRDDAIKDLEERIEMYAKKYNTIEDDESLSYIKLINLQSKLICYHIRGYYPRLLVFFLSNLRVNRRPIWLTRAGESVQPNSSGYQDAEHDHRSRSSSLSEAGIEYSRRLAKFAENYKPFADQEQKWDSPIFDQGDYLVWTSTLKRSIETVQCIPKMSTQWTALNMMDMGEFDGFTVKELKEHEADVYYQFKQDMKNFRFPGGESYNDVAERLEPLVLDLESQLKPVLIVSHLSCLRVLYAYFCGSTLDTLPETPFPRHEVIEFTPTQYGWQEKRFKLMEDDQWKCGADEYLASPKAGPLPDPPNSIDRISSC